MLAPIKPCDAARSSHGVIRARRGQRGCQERANQRFVGNAKLCLEAEVSTSCANQIGATRGPLAASSGDAYRKAQCGCLAYLSRAFCGASCQGKEKPLAGPLRYAPL